MMAACFFITWLTERRILSEYNHYYYNHEFESAGLVLVIAYCMILLYTMFYKQIKQPCVVLFEVRLHDHHRKILQMAHTPSPVK